VLRMQHVRDAMSVSIQVQLQEWLTIIQVCTPSLRLNLQCRRERKDKEDHVLSLQENAVICSAAVKPYAKES
jgi:hypothetical protein